MSYDLTWKVKLAEKFGLKLTSGFSILDFGCGSGKSVREMQKLGYNCFGCDIKFESEGNIDSRSLMSKGIIREIKMEPYILPFDDKTFDLIFSEDVFEHVKNYPETISELSRILKPDGICIHAFSSKYRPVEPHVFVPFASFIQSYWWLKLWVILGVRNDWPDCQSVKARASKYYKHLKENTNYLSRRRLRKYFQTYFEDVRFCEKEFLMFSHRGRKFYNLSRYLPFIPLLYSTFRLRILITRLPRNNSPA
jgi:ubiquinone/menaquinone biosynthesis C-methylase UbiE